MQNLNIGRFYVQSGITFAAVTICLFKIMTSDNPNESQNYWTGLLGILAFWMPAPTTQVESRERGGINIDAGPAGTNEISFEAPQSPNSNSLSTPNHRN
ncbi:hypothetical protein [Leptolyngbya sp. FACHB-261]|uniref:hypothetical protein n=1 Tax=Leptolyngbya sp. FACHB-261 TaxID=2692806 RepID=UPI0016872546|nr:hypothetical protein [Leptolyngbya sp. FACHB-261]